MDRKQIWLQKLYSLIKLEAIETISIWKLEKKWYLIFSYMETLVIW